jgi:hypothetical protein
LLFFPILNFLLQQLAYFESLLQQFPGFFRY